MDAVKVNEKAREIARRTVTNYGINNPNGLEEALCTSAILSALEASPAPEGVETREDQVARIADIIDPHSFMDIPFTDDPVLLDMVEQSKQDALRKAERIISVLSPSPAPDGLVEALKSAAAMLRSCAVMNEVPVSRAAIYKLADECAALAARTAR
jgi:hypothetical protein